MTLHFQSIDFATYKWQNEFSSCHSGAAKSLVSIWYWAHAFAFWASEIENCNAQLYYCIFAESSSEKSCISASNNEHDWTLVKYLNVLHHNRTHSSWKKISWYITKILPFSYFGYFENVWPLPSTMIISACQKWPPLLTYFLRYCKNTANLLLWVIWECLIMPINTDNINLAGNSDAQSVETLMFICMQKINFIFNFFFEIW